MKYPRTGAARRQRALLSVPLLVAVLLGGCDIPTQAPRWDLTFRIPARNTSIAVAQLLPTGVTVSGSTFTVSVAPSVPATISLGSACTECVLLNGQRVPKPAFSGSAAGSYTLPGDVRSLAGTSAEVRLTNNMSFDPLRPSATARGTLTLTIASGGATAGSLVVAGADAAFPPGATVTRTILIAGGLTGSGTLTMALESPPGDPVTINTSEHVRAELVVLRAASAQVRADARNVSSMVNLDLGNVDNPIVRRIEGGALILDITNPFAVTTAASAPLTLRVMVPGAAPIVKSVQLSGAATQRVRVEFSREELRSFFGKGGAVLQVSGQVSGPSGVVTITPTSNLAFSTEFELRLSSTET